MMAHKRWGVCTAVFNVDNLKNIFLKFLFSPFKNCFGFYMLACLEESCNYH